MVSLSFRELSSGGQFVVRACALKTEPGGRERSRFFGDNKLIDEALFAQTGHHVRAAQLEIVAQKGRGDEFDRL
jgi:hypothetical protein